MRVKTFSSPSGISVDKGAQFSIVPDNQAPSIEEVIAIGDMTMVQVVFNEKVNSSQAGDKSRYTISGGITVLNAAVEKNGKRVTLTCSSLTEDTEYTLTVNGISDRALVPNTMAADTFAFTPRAGLYDDFEQGGRLTWTPNDTSQWDIGPDGDDDSYFINTSDYRSSQGKPGAYSIAGNWAFTALSLEVTARIPENSINLQADYGVVFGFINHINYHFMRVSWDSTYCILYKVENNSRSIVESFNVPFLKIRDKNYHTLKIETVNNTLKKHFIVAPLPFEPYLRSIQ